ncbi:MAG TPA: DNA mismatch repair protein MutS [Ktedonobacterales bacterium]
MPTPARRQYLEIKARYADALLAYNIGDFYEFFDTDAETAARELHLTLTARTFGPDELVPLAGVPVHAIEVYAARLVARGYRVAICDQVSPPGRGLVQREVTRVLTPGTVVEPGMLALARDTYLAAIAVGRRDPATGLPRAIGLAWADASVGSFACTQWSADALPHALQAELARLGPAEVLVSSGLARDDAPEAAWLRPYSLTPCPPDAFEPESARIRLCRQFGVATLAGYGCDRLPLATAAAGAIVQYIERVNAPLLALLSDLRTYDTRGFVEMDARVWRALEVVEAGRAETPAPQTGATLLATLDATRTPMGARLLRRTLLQPLRDRAALEARLDALDELVGHISMRQRLGGLLDGLGDLERLAARVTQGAAVPRELFALASGLGRAPGVLDALATCEAAALRETRDVLDPCVDVRELILRAVADPGEATGRRLRAGYSAELDALVESASETRRWIAALEGVERERTGIRSLKVGFNKIFGYYIEVTRPNLARVPDDYQRRQTIATGERFVTAELKEREAQALHADERIALLEGDLYAGLLAELARAHTRLRRTVQALAQLDVWLSLAEVAVARRYTRPELADDSALEIVAGRHPVVETALDGVEFIPNDTALDDLGDGPEARRAMLLTGPNMAGKSTYLRQVALITLMAQIGSFVPAQRARIGLVDRIFARVGAEDDLARGLSTFMLEMVETAFILRHATERSLVVLDEVGRGTSSADGLAIAQAVAERLCDVTGARMLFATHYHELARLEETLPRLRAYRMEVAERDGQAIFLRRVVPGASDHSYGVQVARMAGLPAEVTARAETLLRERMAQPPALIAERPAVYRESAMPAPDPEPVAPSGDERDERELALALASVNLVAVTPLEALNLLFSLQQRALARLGMASSGHARVDGERG